jgi:REP element-mobilizing transposase RayT
LAGKGHIHLLISLSKTLDIAHAMQSIKSGSSTWIHDEFPEYRLFEWQKDFKTEFTSFLDKHFIEYDARFVFDRAFSAVPSGLTV